MRFTFLAWALVLALAACGAGGGGIPVVPRAAQNSAAQQATQSATFELAIPSATASTTFFYVDLQNNTDPRFDNTFAVSSAACPTLAGGAKCTFTGTIPAGDTSALRWSIAAGAGTPGSGPILSVAHNVPSCYGISNCNGTTIYADLEPIVANVTLPNPAFGNEWPPSDYDVCCTSSTGPPYFEIEPVDGAGNAVYGVYGSNPPFDSSTFTNPITIAEDDASGELQLEQIFKTEVGPLASPPGAATLTFARLVGYHGMQNAIAIVDNATVNRTMHVTYSVPAVTLTPAEFPQLQRPFTSPATTGTLLAVTCVPPASIPSGTNPCTAVP